MNHKLALFNFIRGEKKNCLQKRKILFGLEKVLNKKIKLIKLTNQQRKRKLAKISKTKKKKLEKKNAKSTTISKSNISTMHCFLVKEGIPDGKKISKRRINVFGDKDINEKKVKVDSWSFVSKKKKKTPN